MKKTAILIASLVFSPLLTAAEPPRMALWITDPIGSTDAQQCNLRQKPSITPSLPSTAPLLTENDVTHWRAESGHWTLSPVLFHADNAITSLQDHCFVMAIDGKYITSGVVLSAASARMIRFPTISVNLKNDQVELQLNANSHITHKRQIHTDLLDSVFRQKKSAN